MSTLATINGSDLPTNSRADINGNFSALNADKMETSVEGVYAAGEIADPHFRQVITSAGMGAAAAIQATKFLEEKETVHS